ncbi:chorismate-binding protein [Flagellimonas meishanensis]|uniref:chorismate-binding protein n=1 Tax=Flagellimonas meishanensis TaxID=2873264 RepID=UPI001CA67031|nr:chorismate-binding protein [[Muricauda] meishanensis]
MDTIFDKMTASLKADLPFVGYRKPGEKQITVIYQDGKVLHCAPNFEERGFVFAPFDKRKEIVLIKADEIQTGIFAEPPFSETKSVKQIPSGKQFHMDLVQKGIKEIQTGGLEKVVLSRKITTKKSKGAIEIFQDLLRSYPRAFTYLLHHPKVGLWCGATPETLVQIKDSRIKTMSLAATMAFQAGSKPVWGTKEIEEQRLVSEYMKTRLLPFTTKLDLGEATSIRAGNLWHLQSEFIGELLPNADLGKLITSLHPTPAVCGIPVAMANKFINENEGYNRSFYTGFLGELNLWSTKDLSLFVNLRCMELHHETATIFVGGGITGASEPESEWMETQHKSQTMLRVL